VVIEYHHIHPYWSLSIGPDTYTPNPILDTKRKASHIGPTTNQYPAPISGPKRKVCIRIFPNTNKKSECLKTEKHRKRVNIPGSKCHLIWLKYPKYENQRGGPYSVSDDVKVEVDRPTINAENTLFWISFGRNETQKSITISRIFLDRKGVAFDIFKHPKYLFVLGN
jgi:hypothetical protein